MRFVGFHALLFSLLIMPLGLHGQYQWFYPVNRNYYCMSDGHVGKPHEVMFEKAAFGGSQLYGEDGWGGAIFGRKAVVRHANKPSETCVFENGIATSVTEIIPSKRTLDSLYISDDEIRQKVTAYADYDIWGKAGRLRVFSQNPNIDGAFFALLTLLFLGLSFHGGRLPVRLIMVALSSLSFIALLLTESRGALLATAIPAIAMFFLEFRHRMPMRILFCGLLLCFCIVGLTVFLHLGDHFTRELFARDESNLTRMSILREVPAMVAESPNGMGFGNSGANYLIWYRIEDKLHASRTLISNHLTWYVELSNLGRFAYIFGWLAILLLLAMFAWRGGASIALGLWLSIFLSGCFNPVLEEWRLWILPLLSMATLICGRRIIGKRMILTSFTFAAAGSFLLLVEIVHLGRSSSREPSLLIDSRRVYVNGIDPDVWIVGDHQVLSGAWTFVGDEILSYFEKNPESKAVIGYVETIDALPPKVGRLVLAGRQAERFLDCWKDLSRRASLCQPDSLLLISPSVPAVEFPEMIAATGHIRAVVGSLAASLSPKYSIKDLPPWIRIVRGSLLYIPNWVGLSVQF